MTPKKTSLPEIFMGGMGVNISYWLIAKIVSLFGGLGIVSGVALDRILALILQDGDPGGHCRRALAHFPFQDKAKMVLDAFFIEGGASRIQSKRGIQMYSTDPSQLLQALIVCANFTFVWLAKEGHDKPIGINYLEKIQMPIIHAITGAMLAGVDVIVMGAGIPLHIPEVINCLIKGAPLTYPVTVVGEKEKKVMTFDPEKFFGSRLPLHKVPFFIPIISSYTLALVFAKLDKKLMENKSPCRVHGFVVETSTAGGHNAPPRNGGRNTKGEFVYDEKDEFDKQKLVDLGYPFWMGGSYASPEKLEFAKSQGAVGIQVGTILALCGKSGKTPEEDEKMAQEGRSGMTQELRDWIRKRAFLDQLVILTSAFSPTGFPFKVAKLNGTASDDFHYGCRKRVCKQGALRVLYKKPNGQNGYRCPAEPIEDYIRKGGKIEDTIGVRCICEGLLATAGMIDGLPIVTLGDDVSFLKRLMRDENDSYSERGV